MSSRVLFSVILGVLVTLLAACKGGQKHAYTPADEQLIQEQAADTLQSDSLSASLSEEDAPMPIAADELFDDFFFNYAASKRLQLERTRFPLPVMRNDEAQQPIEKRQWKMEPFFMKQDYYTLIFDSPQQLDLVNDTALNHAVVERIMFSGGEVCSYCFDRLRGAWMLTQIVYQPLSHNPNAQFLSFYERFVSDSTFQRQSLAKEITFVSPDPDDDFQTVEGTITPEQWDAFAPELPQGDLFNIVYSNHHPAAMRKIFIIRGIANGLEVEVTFHLQKGRWRLTKLST